MPTDSESGAETPGLRKTLGPLTIWGLGVGYVISGEYFGWNLGLPVAGSLGMLAAFFVVTVLYVTFVFSYAEMACAIPRAGGVFVYAQRGLGDAGGFLGGIAQAVEFVFAAPAIAAALGGYVAIWTPESFRLGADRWLASAADDALASHLPAWAIPRVDFIVLVAVVSYVLFTALNIWGVQQAAIFELFVTTCAVAGIVVFASAAAPHFRLERFTANGLPNGWSGAFAALPFAMWFYLAIEGVANVAEEARDPGRDMLRGFAAAMATLVVLATCTFVLSIGIGGWERSVFEAADFTEGAGGLSVAAGAAMSDSPLPLAVAQIAPSGGWLHGLLVGIGLLGLIASFNGVVLASGRALFEMGRAGFFFRFIGRPHPATHTPVNAQLVNLIIGLTAILFFDTAGLITMASFGAVTLYIVSMVSLIALRRKEPELERPFRTPFYPVFPLTAISIAVICLLSMTYSNFNLDVPRQSYTLWYFGYLFLAFSYFAVLRRRAAAEAASPSNG
jgi:ethanolamine permease